MVAENVNSKYKKVLCAHFKRGGTCEVGSNCNFAHGNRELRSFENPLYKAQLCTAYEQGGDCKLGHDCLFAHGEEEIRSDDIPVVSTSFASSEALSPASSVSPVDTSIKDNSRLYKSTLCIHFSRHGSCNLGDSCTFAHGKEDLVNVIVPNNSDPKYKTKLCLRYAQDKFCPSGDYCVFAHDESELKLLPAAEDAKKTKLFKTTLCHNFSTLGVCPSGKNCGFAHGRFELRPVGFDGNFEAKISENPRWKCTLCKMFLQSGFCTKLNCDFAHGNEELRVESRENPRVLRSNYKRVMCNNWSSNGHCFHEDTCSFAHGEEELQKFSSSKDVASSLKLFRGVPAGLRKRPTTAMSQTGMVASHMGQPQFTALSASVADQKLFAEFLEFKKFKEQTEGASFMPGMGIAVPQSTARHVVTPFFNNFQSANSLKRPAMTSVPMVEHMDPRVNRGSQNLKNISASTAGYQEGNSSSGSVGRRLPRNGNRLGAAAVTEMGNAMFSVSGQNMDHVFTY